MAKKPNISEISIELGNYQAELQLELETLEEKQEESETEARANKIDELQARIDLAENAIDALESLE